MKKLLIVGNSHLGTLISAQSDFLAKHPDVEMSYFALTGVRFQNARCDTEKTLLPHFRSDKYRDLSKRINGAESISLDGWDGILLMGHKLYFATLFSLLQSHSVLEFQPDNRPSVSENFVLDIAESICKKFATTVANAYKDIENLYLTFAPYPANSIHIARPDYVPGLQLEELRVHPIAQKLNNHIEHQLTHHLGCHGICYIRQPADTLARPFATHDTYATDAVSEVGTALHRTDYRHMNASFGKRVFESFAQVWLTDETTKHEGKNVLGS